MTRFLKITTGPANQTEINESLFVLRGPYQEGFTEEYTFDDFSQQNSALVKVQEKILESGAFKTLSYRSKGTSGETVIGEFFGDSEAYRIEWGIKQ